MENVAASWPLYLLKQPLAEPIKVFNNPVKIPQWILLLTSRTQRVLFFLCLPAHSLNAHLAKFPFHRTFNNSVIFSCAPMHLLDALLAELHRILSDSGFYLNSQ